MADEAPTYEELAEAIAHCVYEERYLEEGKYLPSGELGAERNVNNMATTGLEIPTRVLNSLGILKPLDDRQIRNDFTCGPDEFARVIKANQANAVSYDGLVIAAICLLDYHPDVGPLYELLSRLGVVEPDTDPPYDKGERWPSGISTIRWTDEEKRYWSIFDDWKGPIRY
ncbi:MAG: hypothetical protein R3E82_11710 [Pseudomonadales bacterium]